MNILVTGGLGLIGHNIVQMLEQQGHTAVIIDIETNYGIVPQAEIEHLMSERKQKIKSTCVQKIDIVDQIAVKWIMEKHKFDVVIHLASFPRQKVVNANPCLGSRAMSEGLLNLLECSKNAGINKFVYISSSMVYGDFSDGVIEDAVCSPQGQYGIMKLAGEWLVKDYTRRTDMKYTIIRPSAVYGPLDVEDRVIAKFMSQAIRGETLKVNGAEETLDFTYVEDAARGITQAALSDNTANKTYNITRSKSVTLAEAAELSVAIAGSGSIEVRGKDAAFPSRGTLCIDAARYDFGYDPIIDVEAGFKLYYDWLSNDPFYKSKTAV